MNALVLATFAIQAASIIFLGLNIANFFDFSSKHQLKKVSVLGRRGGLHLQHVMIIYVIFTLAYLLGSIGLVTYLSMS